MSDVRVVHEPGSSRYEAFVDDRFAGYASYRNEGDVVVFDHTVVEPAFGGRGVGSALVRRALDDLRAEGGGRRVVAQCWFVAGWMKRHPDYLELAAER